MGWKWGIIRKDMGPGEVLWNEDGVPPAKRGQTDTCADEEMVGIVISIKIV